MKSLYIAASLLILLAQPAPPPDGPPAETETPAPEIVRVLVIHATREEGHDRQLDPDLAAFDELLSTLPYNTFRSVLSSETEADYGAESAVPLNGRYALALTPQSVTDLGEVLFEAHIDLTENDNVVEALRISGRAARGQSVVFRGLTMPEGELIVVMSMAQPPPPGGGRGGGNRPAESPREGGTGDREQGGGGAGAGQQDPTDPSRDFELALEDEDEPAPAPEPETETEQSETAVPAPEAEEGDPLPPDLANLEGILRALEEQDMREQEQARNRRFDVVIQGDWW